MINMRSPQNTDVVAQAVMPVKTKIVHEQQKQPGPPVFQIISHAHHIDFAHLWKYGKLIKPGENEKSSSFHKHANC